MFCGRRIIGFRIRRTMFMQVILIDTFIYIINGIIYSGVNVFKQIYYAVKQGLIGVTVTIQLAVYCCLRCCCRHSRQAHHRAHCRACY